MMRSPQTILPDELASFRTDMVKFARLQLRDDSLAEDAVHDSLVAALDGLEKFKKRAQLKTWVFSILKYKIIDIIRERRRLHSTGVDVNEIPEETIDEMFDENGQWHEDARPSAWGDPEQSFSNQQFWQIFELCLNRLPESTARVFMMREMLGFETEEICKELSIKSSNCWVVLHRARMSLRFCLNERWFQAVG
jgi:RNA polymerase sigma-70 factor (ECF subfamily)